MVTNDKQILPNCGVVDVANRPIAQCHFTDEIVEVFDIKYGVITVKYPDGTFISEDLDCNSYYFPSGQSVSNLLWLAQNGANI